MKQLATLLTALLLFANIAAAQVEPDSVRRAAWQQFQQTYGFDWQVTWHKKTGTPSIISNGITEPDPRPPLQIARAFLSENHRLFGMQPGLPNLKLLSERRLGSVHHVRFQQTYQGLPVYDAHYLVHPRLDGRISMANGTFYPNIEVPTTPQVSARTAQEIAIDDLEDLKVRGDDVESELVILPQEGQFHLAWKLTMPIEPFGGWLYFVDARQGAILKKHDLLMTTTGDGDETAPPEQFTLKENAPNPFRERTTIRYGLSEQAQVEVTVYDALGRQVARLASGAKEAGWHTARFEASGLPSGVYLVRMRAGSGFTATERLVVAK